MMICARIPAIATHTQTRLSVSSILPNYRMKSNLPAQEKLHWATKNATEQRVSGRSRCGSFRRSWLGEVRVLNLRINLDFLNRKRLFEFRAGTALVNLKWVFQSFHVTVIGKGTLPRQFVVCD